jgi:hypothetical protein
MAILGKIAFREVDQKLFEFPLSFAVFAFIVKGFSDQKQSIIHPFAVRMKGQYLGCLLDGVIVMFVGALVGLIRTGFFLDFPALTEFLLGVVEGVVIGTRGGKKENNQIRYQKKIPEGFHLALSFS